MSELPHLLIIGAGGVGASAVHKASQNHTEFASITHASRTMGKLERIRDEIKEKGLPLPDIRMIDAKDRRRVAELIKSIGSNVILLNLATPYCNESLLDACLQTGAHYLDTAVAEKEHVENMPAPWYQHVEWPRRDKFAEQKSNCLLGIGFDPGVVNIFCAHLQNQYFDEINSIDIIDVNGGNHGQYFATNFDPDTNLREIMEDVLYWKNGSFVTIPHHSRKMSVDLPLLGEHTVYSMGHDELHSLPLTFDKAERIEFWMGFGDHYLKVFDVLNNLGLLSSKPVDIGGTKIAPLRMLKALLPDPASLAENYTGEVLIGCDVRGIKDGQQKRYFIYTTCKHQDCYADTNSQAISYTTAIPAVTAAILLARGAWNPQTMVHVETLDPEPFLNLMPKLGLSWQVEELNADEHWSIIDSNQEND